MENYTLEILARRLAVAKLDPDAGLPTWANGQLVSVTRTATELSIVCDEENIPPETTAERGWVCLRIAGPLSFDQVGVIASLANPLKEAGIPLFAISTYDTEYLLVKNDGLDRTIEALTIAGHTIIGR